MKTRIKLTIAQAVSRYLYYKIKESQAHFKHFLEEMLESYGSKFQIIDSNNALTDFTIARLAIDCYSLRNIYPELKAEEIKKRVLMAFLSGLEAKNEKKFKAYFEEYSQILSLYDNGMEDIRLIGFEKVAEKFLISNLGENINGFLTPSPTQADKIISPVFTRIVARAITSSILTWEGLNRRAEVT